MRPVDACNLYLGEMGRMISGSKIAPKGHICVWNANVIVDGKKVWYGDIDLTKDAKRIQIAANEIQKPLYILREMDARFDNESTPKLERAVAVIQPVPIVDTEKLVNALTGPTLDGPPDGSDLV